VIILGVDEVGRGCLAGPLVAGAVILNKPIIGLKDSKKLSKLKRERLSAEIRLQARAFGVGWVEPQELDKVGLTAAVRLAMQRAVDQIKISYDRLIVDGNYNFFINDPRARAIIKADDSVPAVSAASIIAKVARDNFMYEQAKLYPSYHFEKHVGYGTSLHLEMLKLHGVCLLHRQSFQPVRARL
jgi:ribonuclease HII